MKKIRNNNRVIIKYVLGTRVYGVTNRTDDAYFAYTTEVAFQGAAFNSNKTSLVRTKETNLLSHQWNTTIQQYNKKNYVENINLGSSTFDISCRLYNRRFIGNAWLPTRDSKTMYINDTVRYDISLLKQCANADIANKTPGKLVYRVYSSQGYDYVESYLYGYITGITVKSIDKNGWAADVDIQFLSIDGYWIQEITKSGSAGDASTAVKVGMDLNFESNCDYEITLYNTVQSQWDGFTLTATKYNKTDIIQQRCATTDSYVCIDTRDGKAYSDSKDDYIPWLSSRKNPFKPLECAGARYVTIQTPYSYSLTIYNKLTQPVIRYMGDE